jgi:phosphopantetheine adenylyltransferase
LGHALRSSSLVLDIASKQEVRYLVSGLRCRADTPVADVDDELAALMRRAPCPLWTIQLWAAQSSVHFAVAVVGAGRPT